MATKRYTVVDGEVLAETTNGQRITYVPDPGGSVVALMNENGAIVGTKSYWPYGEVSAESGTTTSMKFVGTLGYYSDSVGRTYVRARHYQPQYGRWMSADPLWPLEPPFEYAAGSPVVFVDPAGRLPLTFFFLQLAQQRSFRVAVGPDSAKRLMPRTKPRLTNVTNGSRSAASRCRSLFRCESASYLQIHMGKPRKHPGRMTARSTFRLTGHRGA